MSAIFNTNPENISESWIKDIKKPNIYKTSPISLIIPAKLIVLAWAYATYQTHELKNRFGNINFVECIEDIFINKLAEIALALQFGFHDGDILSGKSFVHLDPSSLDERTFIELPAIIKGKTISVTGVKKFTYPTIQKYPSCAQIFVYIDALRYKSNQQTITRLNIQHDHIKATIIGYGTKSDLKINQNQQMLSSYSNKHSAFVGFELLRNIDGLTFSNKKYNVPKYVNELLCFENIEVKINDIITYLKNISDVKPIIQIDYAALFDPIIK